MAHQEVLDGARETGGVRAEERREEGDRRGIRGACFHRRPDLRRGETTAARDRGEKNMERGLPAHRGH